MGSHLGPCTPGGLLHGSPCKIPLKTTVVVVPTSVSTNPFLASSSLGQALAVTSAELRCGVSAAILSYVEHGNGLAKPLQRDLADLLHLHRLCNRPGDPPTD